MKVEQCKPGVPVRYYPSGRAHAGFVGEVREMPWQLGDGTWVTHLHKMEPAYRNGEKTIVHGAMVEGLKLLRGAGG